MNKIIHLQYSSRHIFQCMFKYYIIQMRKSNIDNCRVPTLHVYIKIPYDKRILFYAFLSGLHQK